MSAPPGESHLITQLRETVVALQNAGIRYMLIGGVAVNIHGYLRATRDLDLMLLVEDADIAHATFMGLGYQTLDHRADIASYVRGTQRLDVLYAQRPISRGLLEQPAEADFNGLKLPVVSLEGLLGLKIQAFSDDPRRIRDFEDMMQLVKARREDLDFDEVRSYFRLFDKESLFDAILKAIG